MSATRKFLERALSEGLSLGIVTPADVLGHATASVLAHSLPADKRAKLLEVSLESGKMTPELIIETVGAKTLAEHVPQGVLWACISEVAERAIGAGDAKPKSKSAAKPTSERAKTAKPDERPVAAAKEPAKRPPAPSAGRTNRNTVKRSPLSPAARFKASGKPLENPATGFEDVQTNVRDDGPSDLDEDVWPIATDYDVIEEAEADAMIVQTQDAWPAGTPAGSKS